HRGPGGGFVFLVPPEQITLRQVIEGIEGKPRQKLCILGGHAPPPINDRWTQIIDLSNKLLDETTIADLNRGWTGIANEIRS
ncbi:MAG: Rrf2 family transcriptional regulator, partial [Planctomycetota bacterium]